MKQTSTIQGFFARASMKTMEKIDSMKLDAEKSCGLEVEMDDPIFKQLQSAIVQEEDVLVQLKRITNDFINSVTIFAKKDVNELEQNMQVMIKARGTDEQKNRLGEQLKEYTTLVCAETTDVSSWAIVELQECVLNRVDKRLADHEITRAKFWKLKRVRGNLTKLNKIASIDNKSRQDLPEVMKEVVQIEKELVDELLNKKEFGIGDIAALWNEYCRIEAEYFSKMNDAFLNERSTPSPRAITIHKTQMSVPWVRSPVIGGSDEESDPAIN